MLYILSESLKYENPNETFFPYTALSMSFIDGPARKELLRTIANNPNYLEAIHKTFDKMDEKEEIKLIRAETNKEFLTIYPKIETIIIHQHIKRAA